MVASTMHHETRIAAGELRGRQLDTADGTTIAFLGIPYAAPPIGARRFAQAEPAPQWTGIREATQWGASQPQPDDALSTLLGFAAPQLRDEDCLTINVWTPAIDDRRRPVLVWIHGGGFISGTSAAPVCDGARLSARGDIVVVSFNYRVGALGFLYLDDERSNFGLGDQIAALRWVRDNIAAFGGDPERVTICGESAGGGSVCALLAAPAARGLFRAAIIQSAAPRGFITTDEAVERRERLLERLLEQAGSTSPEHADVQAWLAAQQACASERQWRTGMLFTPVVGGAWLPIAPAEAMRTGQVPDVPLMIGTNRDELQLYGYGQPRPDLSAAQVEATLAALLPGCDVARLHAAVRAARAAREESLDGIDVLRAILTELVIRVPSIRMAEQHAARGQKAYMYMFEWASPIQDGELGACHALELPFVFGTLELPELAPLIGPDPLARELADKMMNAWIDFVLDARPDLAAWSPYQADRRVTRCFGPSFFHFHFDPRAPERRALDFI